MLLALSFFLSIFHILTACFTDDYDAARAKLHLAEETSTLETDAEDVLSSRKRTKKKITSDSDEEDESVIHKKTNKSTSKKLIQVTVPLPEPPDSLQGSISNIITNSRKHKHFHSFFLFILVLTHKFFHSHNLLPDVLLKYLMLRNTIQYLEQSIEFTFSC